MEGDVVLLGLMDWNAGTSTTGTQFIPLPTSTEVCYELLTGGVRTRRSKLSRDESDCAYAIEQLPPETIVSVAEILLIVSFISFQAPQTHPVVYDQPRAPYINGHHTNGLSPSSPSSHLAQQYLSETNLYIKNLPPEYSDKDLAALVEG